jgi:hypothetical protein
VTVLRGAAIPDWLAYVRGDAPILLVAPHGGRRPYESELAPGKSRKVNDLHTAEITLELAARLSASAIVNRAEDRNRVDLNRVSDVRARAPWLLDLLVERVRAQFAAVDCATLLFVHGWNAIQPACDLGIGARLDASGFVAVKQGVPTISFERAPRLERFAETCAAAGINVTIGDRYPAAGRENVMQIFTRRYAEDADPRIRELAALGEAGKIFAVQIELATPLRWPGALRDHVLAAIAELTRDPERGPRGMPRRPVRRAPTAIGGAQPRSVEHRTGPPRQHEIDDRLAIEFHDGANGVGGFAGIDRTAAGRRQGRFLFCAGARRLVLFTGEEGTASEEPLRCAGLLWRRSADGEVAIDFAGPCLTFPRVDPFLDLEAGLADALLSELEAHLVWRPLPGANLSSSGSVRLGRMEGQIRYDGESSIVAAPAALQDGLPARETTSWHERRALRVPLGGDAYASIASRTRDDEILEGELVHGGRSERILSGRISVRNSADPLVPEAWRIEVVSRTTKLRVFGHVTHVIPVVRPAPDGKILTLFGLARFSTDGSIGFGTFEQSRRIGSGHPARTPPGSKGRSS